MLFCAVARPLRRASRFVVFAAVLLTAASGLVTPPPVDAAGPRPAFQIPFRCGERWGAFTRSGHPAIDWNYGTGSDDLGATVTASAAGTAFPRYHSAYGYYVDVDHGGGWITRYAHLLGDGLASGPVAQGEPIGRVGSTGSSTAPHLHWEQRADGVAQSTLIADGEVLRADGRTYVSRNCLRRDPFLSGDIDGDGFDDMVARFVASDGSSSLKIVAGASNRELRTRRSLSLSPADLPATALLSLGDTNGDGRADLNAAYAHDGGVKFVSFYGTTAGTFGGRRTRHVAGGWSFHRMKSVQTGDVNRDDIADLTVRFVQADGSSVIRTLAGATTRSMPVGAKKVIDASVLPATALVATGDTNDDGSADLNAAYGIAGGVRLVSFFGTEDGSFGRRRLRHSADAWSARGLKSLRIADVNGDGPGDFVTRFVRSGGGSTLRVVRGDNRRSLETVATQRVGGDALPRSAFIAVGDTNGDRRADFNAALASGGGTRFASFYGRRDGTFGDRRTRFTGSWDFHRLC